MLYKLFTENIEIFDMISEELSLNDLEILARVCKPIYNKLNTDLLEWYRKMRAINAVIKCIDYTCGERASMRDGIMYTVFESAIAGKYITCSGSGRYQIIHESW